MTSNHPETVEAPETPSALFIQALGLRLDPAWRRQDPTTRAADAAEFAAAYQQHAALGVTSFSYSTLGLKADVDLVLWRMAPSVEALEASVSTLLNAGVGRWMRSSVSLLGQIGASQYVRRPTSQEQSMFEGERSRYLIVYPFTKSTDWYLLGREARQGVMNEHMRIGHDYPQVRQLLGYSFGLDDFDFVVAYETDDLAGFGDLVRALRATESRKSTVLDTPILLGIHRSIDEILSLLGA